jgi:hypothetical protein
MKKLVLSIAITGLAMGAFAQGLVSLQDASVFVSTNSTSIGGGVGLITQSVGSYRYELLFIADPSGETTSIPTFTPATLGSWTDAAISGTNNTALGHGTSGIIGQNSTGGEAVNGWLSGEVGFYVVLGWSVNEGTWTQVQAALNGGSWLTTGANGGLFGYSSVGYDQAATSPAPAAILFGAQTGLINTGWQLTPIPVPEPSTIALAGLGGLGLLLFRRRK